MFTLYLVDLCECLGSGDTAILMNDEQLCERLDAVKWRKHELHKLGDMYRGAIQALESSNPDRCAHAANSLRELLEKLVYHATGAEDKKDEDTRLFKSLRKDMNKLLSDYKENMNNNKTLEDLLSKLGDYLDLNEDKESTSQKERLAEALGGVHEVYYEVQKENVKLVWRFWKELNNCAHHQADLAPDYIKECLEKLKPLLYKILDNLPVTSKKGTLDYSEQIQKEHKKTF